MKTLIFAMMLAVTVVSGVLTLGLTALSHSAFATDPGPSKPTHAPADISAGAGSVAPGTAQSRSAVEDPAEVGERGQLEELMSLCDVAPPCPSGCTVDAVSRKCIEWPGP